MSTNTHRPICQIAAEIRADWGAKVNFAAKPYLYAMLSLHNVTDTYGCESAKTQILYFLSNAGTYRGDKAKVLKAELKKMVGLK
jgi:hypothetical protein